MPLPLNHPIYAHSPRSAHRPSLPTPARRFAGKVIKVGSALYGAITSFHPGQLRQARMLMVQLELMPTAKKTTPGHCG